MGKYSPSPTPQLSPLAGGRKKKSTRRWSLTNENMFACQQYTQGFGARYPIHFDEATTEWLNKNTKPAPAEYWCNLC